MSLFLPWSENLLFCRFSNHLSIYVRNVCNSVPRVERDTVANSPPLFYHSTQLSCRQNNQCLLEGLRAKGYVCVPGWSLSSRLCAHFPLFVLGTDKQRVGQIASLLCACGGSDQDGSGCPPRIYLRRLCAVSLQFCVLIRTSAPCERLSSICNDAATIAYQLRPPTRLCDHMYLKQWSPTRG